MRRRAVVIGAGAAGLAATRALRRAGFDVRALEQHAELGGVWASTKYPLTMHARSFSYRFHDFPAMASRGPSATQDEVRAYFTAYARAKGIADLITFDRRVDRIVVRPERDRGRCLVVAGTEAHECELVVCATGYSNAGRPHVPALPGRETSQVRVLHSSQVSPEIFDDLTTSGRTTGRRCKVVVLGAGKSAHDILWWLRGQPVELVWVYLKSLWSTSYEKLYSDPVRAPWNAALYLYYLGAQVLRRRLGWGRAMQLVQAPLVRSGYLVNPLEPSSDIACNRGAILKAEQLAYLKTVPSLKAGVVGLGAREVRLDRGDALAADYLICATGYDRRADLPALSIETATGSIDHSLADQHGLYQHMIDPAVPEVSVLSAAILYPQHVLGFSLGAEWLARFHTNRLAAQPTRDDMERWLARRAREFGPWCSGDYLSGGVPYAHQRDKDVLPALFAQMGIAPRLAHALHLRGTDEEAFGKVCDLVARKLGVTESHASEN